jgi:hypothetical protein
MREDAGGYVRGGPEAAPQVPQPRRGGVRAPLGAVRGGPQVEGRLGLPVGGGTSANISLI